MAAPTIVTSRVERSLNALLAEVRELPGVAADWDNLSDGERAAIALDWDHLIADYLTELEGFRRSAAMTAEQETRYHELVRHLHEAQPLFRRLGLQPIPLLSDK